MDFEQALVYELQAITGFEDKVFPQSAPENTEPPFVVYFSTEGEPLMTLGGPTDITELTCEIHVVTDTYESLKGLTRLILERVKSFFSRSIGQNGPLIRSVSHVEPTENIDKNLNYYSSSFDIRIRF